MKNPKILYLCNAFSLQMLDLNYINEVIIKPVHVGKINDAWVADVNGEQLPLTEIESSIGHQDMANYLGVQLNRTSTHLNPGDTILVAQLTGGRLAEGVTSLPEGAKIEFLLVTARNSIDIVEFFQIKEDVLRDIGSSVTYGDMEIYCSIRSACWGILRGLEKSPGATIEALKEFLRVKE